MRQALSLREHALARGCGVACIFIFSPSVAHLARTGVGPLNQAMTTCIFLLYENIHRYSHTGPTKYDENT